MDQAVIDRELEAALLHLRRQLKRNGFQGALELMAVLSREGNPLRRAGRILARDIAYSTIELELPLREAVRLVINK